jgi:AAA15 family ATPase/GTPase
MLRSFRLQNHRSFRGEAELSLLPSYQTDRTAVPVAAIYGANAAGKSSLLDGLRFMSRAVVES